MAFRQLIESNKINELYVKPDEFKGKHVSYGTAGFRMRADHLDWIMYRMGLLACLRSISLKCKYIGCMVTASHNPIEDNGCKLIDPLGDMLEEKWETYASRLVNSEDLRATLRELCSNELKQCVDEYEKEQEEAHKLGRVNRPNVLVAHDTRPSCAALLAAFKSGVELLGGLLGNNGLLSTPQLHYIVRCLNTSNAYGEPNQDGYFSKLTRAFFKIWSMLDLENTKYQTDLYVDGANGVGADKIKILAKYINNTELAVDENRNHHQQLKLNVHLFNEAKEPTDQLNHLCGADYVKVQQKPPLNLPESDNDHSQVRKYCSFDGDADRIVYYYMSSSEQQGNAKKFHLLDGDKISTLVATHLKELVECAQLGDRVNLCIVQTAYANGSSTDYIQNHMKVKVSCVPTGVKHLHHEAQMYDIGVYFEANGHGTIIFSENAEKIIEDKYALEIQPKEETLTGIEFRQWLKENKPCKSIYNLKHLKDCINQTVGDAISDLLLVELILASRGLTIQDWDVLYTDLPSRQLKVTVKDRNAIKTTDAERRVSEPLELQSQIDQLVAESKTQKSRAFVRPSGTEDVVRVYAEDDTQLNADLLAKKVSQLVYDLAGGVGNRP